MVNETNTEKQSDQQPDGNELHMHYVNVEEEKQQSIVLPLISLIIAVLSFIFYPFQIAAITFSFLTIYVTRNHAITYKPMTIIALTLALSGFFLGLGGVDIYTGLQPVFKEMNTGVSCTDLELNVENACYNLETKMLTATIRPNKDVYKVDLKIVTDVQEYTSETKDEFFANTFASIELPFDVETRGIPISLEMSPVLKSYIEKRTFSCLNSSQLVPLEACP
jgi:hypothetical protein